MGNVKVRLVDASHKVPLNIKILKINEMVHDLACSIDLWMLPGRLESTKKRKFGNRGQTPGIFGPNVGLEEINTD